jgi:hypothetical protein
MRVETDAAAQDTCKNGLVAKAAGFNPVVPAVSSLCDETASTAAGRVT